MRGLFFSTYKDMNFVFVFLLLQFLKLSFSQRAAKDDTRQPSMFKVGDEWLSLPEVFSNLDFAADSTPALDDDITGQIKLRSTRFWGRLYIDGWPQTIQYFRAHFGKEPPLGRKRFVFAEPRDACDDLTNSHLLTKDHVLLVNRGTCTFGTKAKNAQKTNASAIIIINNEPGIDHLPGPDAHDIDYSVSSISQQEGQLLEAFYDQGPGEDGFGRRLEGFIVPMNCPKSGANCFPSTFEEKQSIKSIIEGIVCYFVFIMCLHNNKTTNQAGQSKYFMNPKILQLMVPISLLNISLLILARR